MRNFLIGVFCGMLAVLGVLRLADRQIPDHWSRWSDPVVVLPATQWQAVQIQQYRTNLDDGSVDSRWVTRY